MCNMSETCVDILLAYLCWHLVAGEELNHNDQMLDFFLSTSSGNT